MNTSAKFPNSSEKYLIVARDVAMTIAHGLNKEVCDLLKEREVKRKMGEIEDNHDKWWSDRIEERKALTEGISSKYQLERYRKDWHEIETIGYRKWKKRSDEEFAAQIAANRAKASKGDDPRTAAT